MKKSWVIVIVAALSLAGAAWGAASEAADAAQNRDMEALRTLVKQHANVNTPQTDGTTALQWAAHWNDLDAVKLLIGTGANAKTANRYGATPLSEAAVLGNAAMIDALLNAGADPKTLASPDGQTVLMTAARAGNLDAVKALLSRGADVNARETYRGQTALMWAAAEHHPEVVKALLEHGADWKVLSLDRETRMPKLSAASSITPVARGGLTALSFAAREGDIESAQAMIQAGCDINQVDADGTSALVIGLMNQRYTFAKFLLDKGADPNVTDVNGRAALYAAIDARNEDYSAMPARKGDDPMPSLDIVKALLDRGANTNTPLTRNLPGRSGMDSGDTTLDEGTTPLMRAARAGDAAVMRLLLAKGANPKLTTRDGNTAFLFAAGVGYRDKNTRGTESEALEAVKVALDQHPDIGQTNARGETALHGAALRGADSIVQFLVDHGAKLDAKTKRDLTPLDAALGSPVPHESTVALIRKLGGREGKELKQTVAKKD